MSWHRAQFGGKVAAWSLRGTGRKSSQSGFSGPEFAAESGRHEPHQLLREFKDSNGIQWRVWDINPVLHARPSNPGRKRASIKVPPGWLCFEGGGERRRLTPVPTEWATCDIAALEVFCATAEPVPIIEREFDAGPAT